MNDDLELRRKKLIASLEKRGYIREDSVKKAMERVPREEFVPENARENAYQDNPLSIGFGQTISAPHMNAMMCCALELDGGSPIKLLEIGTGSGYHAALCAEILRENSPESMIVTVERIPELAERAKSVFRKLGYLDIITPVISDGTLGHEEMGPYDRILVTAAAPRVPPALLDQLANGGLMLIPVGKRRAFQRLLQIRRKGDSFHEKKLSGVVFVPLIGKEGFDS